MARPLQAKLFKAGMVHPRSSNHEIDQAPESTNRRAMAYKALTKKLKIYIKKSQMAILNYISQVEILIKTDTSKEVTQIKEFEPTSAKLDDSLALVQNPLRRTLLKLSKVLTHGLLCS